MANPGDGVGSSERVALATISQWAKKVSEQTTRNLPLMAILKKKGLIEYGNTGPEFRWPVRKADHELSAFQDMQPITFSPKNTKTMAVQQWRGRKTDDLISMKEKLEQGGPEAMVKIFNDREKLMREGAIRSMAAECYVDGEAAASIAGEKFHGIESMMSINAGAQVATSLIATTHDATYARLSTVVGTVAGVTASTDPNSLARIWTPQIINTSQNPGTGTKAWRDYAIEYIRAMLLRATHGPGQDDQMDLVTLNRDAYEDALNLMDEKSRILVERGKGAALVSMGFSNVFEVDGCPVIWDAACPTTDADSKTVRGYGWNTSQMMFKVLCEKGQKTLFGSKVEFNITYMSDLILLWCLGNFKFESPRHFGKLVDIS